MKKGLFLLFLSASSLIYSWPNANSATETGTEILFASYEITDASTLKSNLSQMSAIISPEARKDLFTGTIESIKFYSSYNQKHALELMGATIEVGKKLSSDYPDVKIKLEESINKAQSYFNDMQTSAVSE
jgi:hypothetical protein